MSSREGIDGTGSDVSFHQDTDKDDDTVIVTVSFTKRDLKTVLMNIGYNASDESINRLLTKGIPEGLHLAMRKAGWNYLYHNAL